MTAILNALGGLNQSLRDLELAAYDQEQKVRRAQQHDLFNGASVKVNGKNGHHGIDPALLAKKLDVAIERIEQVLREG